MGLLKAKWVSDRWWSQTPFNYCDHFGDKVELAKFCIICRKELNKNSRIFDHYEIEKIPTETWVKLNPEIEISLEVKCVEKYGNIKNPSKIPLCNIVNHYGAYVGEIVKNLLSVPKEADIKLIEKSLDCLGHSQHYAPVKIMRAYDSSLSREEMEGDSDSKNSALFAYVAINRNSRALLALSQHKPLAAKRDYFLKMAATSIEICDLIQNEFFPGDELDYEEFGCNYFKDVSFKN